MDPGGRSREGRNGGGGRWLVLLPDARERREKAWCAYCIAGALINFGILALTLPEAKRALLGLAAR